MQSIAASPRDRDKTRKFKIITGSNYEQNLKGGEKEMGKKYAFTTRFELFDWLHVRFIEDFKTPEQPRIKINIHY